jgi:hypothetical protein
MNLNDRNNLNFLMNATPEVLLEWYDTASEDDLIYAQELLDAYQMELNASEYELLAPSTNTLQ